MGHHNSQVERDIWFLYHIPGWPLWKSDTLGGVGVVETSSLWLLLFILLIMFYEIQFLH